jgi:hypothetical protein
MKKTEIQNQKLGKGTGLDFESDRIHFYGQKIKALLPLFDRFLLNILNHFSDTFKK